MPDHEQKEPVLYAGMLHEDAEKSIARVALRGENTRAINHLSTTTYEVVYGEGVMDVDGTEHELREGVSVTVPSGTPYKDAGHVVMIATSRPPFNAEFVEVLDDKAEDPRMTDIRAFIESGMAGLTSETTFDTAPGRLRNAYDYAWQKVKAYLFDPKADWRAEKRPDEQIMGIFARFWELYDTPELAECAMLAFVGYWSKGKDNKMEGALFHVEPDREYPDTHVLKKLEDICQRRKTDDTPVFTAQMLMNYAAVVHLTWRMMPPGLSTDEAQLGVRGILNKGGPSLYS